MLKKTLLFLSCILGSLFSQSQVTFQAEETTGCSPMGVIINVTSPAAGSISSYSWTITRPDGTTHQASSPQYIAIFTQPGTYDVSLTINGSTNSTQLDYITVFPNPQPAFSGDDTSGCFPLCVQFSDNTTLGSAPIIEWNWDFGNGITSNSQNPNYCYPTAGTFTPILTVEDANGCFSSIANPAMISVSNQFPNAQFTLTPSITCGVPETISFTNSSTGNSALSESWNFGDASAINTSSATTLTHEYTSTGVFNACLTVTDEIGCTNQECHSVNIFNQAQAAFIVSSTNICVGQSITFSNQTQPAGGTYQWDFNGDGITDSTQPSPTYSFTQQGTFSPSLTVTYSPTCSHTLSNSVSITVNPGFIPSFTSNIQEDCSIPSTIQFTNTTTTGGLSYSWSIEGNPIGSGPTVNYTFNNFGAYDVTLTATNASGCMATTTLNNYIQIQLPEINFDLPIAVCTGSTVYLENINIQASETIVSYSWDFDADLQEDSDEANPSFVYANTGYYPITCTVVTQTGCTSTYTHPDMMIVLQDTQTDFTTNFTYTCAGESIEFCITNPGANEFSFNFGDQSGWHPLAEGGLCITHDYQDTGYFDISMQVFNGACNSLQEFPDYLYITPPVALFNFGIDCDDLLTVQFGDQSILADSIIWDFGDGSPTVLNNPNPTHTYAAGGTYNITLTAINDDVGCPDIVEGSVTLEPVNANLTFTTITNCPPAQVQVQSETVNYGWDLVFSDGSTLIANFDETTALWTVVYTHNGEVEMYQSNSVNAFWPTLEFLSEGCYDVVITATNAYGCSTTVNVDDAICVTTDINFAAFTSTIISDCNPVQIQFTPNANNIVDFDWSFSDGTSSVDSNPTHAFNAPYYYNLPTTATLTATDANGCTSMVTQTIDIVLPVIPSFSTIGAFSCQGEEVLFINTTTGPAAAYSWTFGDPGSGTLNTSSEEDSEHTYYSNGVFQVCLSATNANGCVRTTCDVDAVQITNPTADFTYNSSINNCVFGVNFDNTSTGLVQNIQWDFGDNQTGSGDIAYHSYPIGVYDVELIVSNNYGCSDTLVVPDIFNYGNVIGPYSTTLDDANCAPFSVEFNSFNTTDTYFSYFWDFDDGYGDPSGTTTSTHDYLQSGTYCPQLIMTDPNGCQVFIQCQDPIVVQEFTLEYNIPSEMCTGDTLLVQISNGESYSWNNNTDITATGNLGEYLLHPTVSSTFELTGFYSDCERTDIINIIVHNLPVVTLETDTSVCFGDPVYELFGGLPIGPNSYYTIDGSLASSFNPSNTANTGYDISYFYTDANGCTNHANQEIFIHALPTVELMPFMPVCESEPEFELIGGSPIGGDYFVNGTNTETVNPQNGYSTLSVHYVYTDELGCVNSAFQPLEIAPLPIPFVDFDPTCEGSEFIVDNQSTIPLGIIEQTEWTFGSSLAQFAFEPAPVVYNSPGEYILGLELMSNHGCVSYLDSTFWIMPTPTAEFNTPNGCQYTELELISYSTIESGNINNFIWNMEGQTSSGMDTLLYPFSTWGQVYVSLTAVSDMGCADVTSNTITVHPSPVLNLIGESVCFNAPSYFNANGSIGIGGIVDYEWTLSDGQEETSGANIDHLFEAPGDYTVTVAATSNLGCVTVDSMITTVYSNPIIDFTLDQTVVCQYSPLMGLDLSTIDSPYEVTAWEWFLDQTLMSTVQNPVLYPENPGLFDVRFVAYSAEGCSTDSTIQNYIQVHPKPIADFYTDQSELTMGEPMIAISDASSEDVSTWNYNFGDGTEQSFDSGHHTYTEWGSFTITQIVSNIFGCSDTSYRTITITKDLLVFIPNAFTPDGNGHNETFRPIMSGFEPSHYEFQVFDRWGNVVFKSTNPEEAWNGSIHNDGAVATDGAYNWLLKVATTDSNQNKTMQGVVLLLH